MKEVLVGIVMGSDSDLPIMKAAAEVLEELGVGYELLISSAHRTPLEATQYAAQARARGLKVIIAGAGGAAHLPGVLAAFTNLPVIGVPIETKTLGGVDSLYSIVQMPSGIPVATMAINGAKNAGIFAAQIIGSQNKQIEENLNRFRAQMEKVVKEKNAKLNKVGIEQYLQKE
ncbi:MAG: 5-(carboxyamino)imidazole ribonucleotide mutase [Bacillota bacterium]